MAAAAGALARDRPLDDIPLAPDWERYKLAETGGFLAIFTARADTRLVGYAIYFLPPHPHYSSTGVATQDILYLDKTYRRGGNGLALLEFSHQGLRELGVTVVQQHSKMRHSIGRLLERMGYEAMDMIYTKRLDR
jgi:hypothetical protein